MSATIRVPIPLSQEQHDRLTAAGALKGLGITAYIRMVALEAASQVAPSHCGPPTRPAYEIANLLAERDALAIRASASTDGDGGE